MKIAALHLEGEAIQWHQGFMRVKSDQQVTWEEYIEYMGARFGTHAYRDPLSDLRNSKQVGSLQDYLDSFDELYLCAKIREDQTLSSFLSGLCQCVCSAQNRWLRLTPWQSYKNSPLQLLRNSPRQPLKLLQLEPFTDPKSPPNHYNHHKHSNHQTPEPNRTVTDSKVT